MADTRSPARTGESGSGAGPPPSGPGRPPCGVRVLAQCFERSCDRHPDAVAVVHEGEELTYRELDRHANRLAHLLAGRGAGPGRAVGILLERSLDLYVALLGVIKSGAAYVPLDPSFPADRLVFIAEDAGLGDLVTTSGLRPPGLPCPVLELDTAGDEAARRPDARPCPAVDPSSVSYVIYTSGTTGRPKGVAVSHAGIVNFLRVVTPVYGVSAEDRVYQGLSIAFDFAVEEIWPAWTSGATLVAGPTDGRRAGHELSAFLVEQRVTVLCCVPTLLATLDTDVPLLRILLVSGEACPPDLVRRWSRPGRRLLNAYGPTEATVTATCAELDPDRPVTIGTPLPTYTVYLLDDELRPVADGESGEICVGGPGVAIGYVNRPELTAERFLPNPVEHDRAEVPRIYRTGDRGRFTPAGEIEYLGRVDTQVKIRGYRIETAEIEAVLREDPAVENAVVIPLERDGVAQDLIGYVTLTGQLDGGEEELRVRLRSVLRRRLPAYMIPAYVEVLPAFPLLAADKVDRAALPAPVSPPLARRDRPRAAPATPLERQLAAAWREITGADEVSVEDDFFCDLGGHSMTAARLMSRLRQHPELRGLAMGDLYAHPTVRSLAARASEAAASEAKPGAGSPAPPPLRHSAARVWACGLAQAVGLYVWLLLIGLPAVALLYRFFRAVGADVRGPAPGGLLDRLVALPLGPFLLLNAVWLLLVGALVLPLLGARLLMAGVRPGHYPLWGVTYLRFWLHGKVLAFSLLPLLAGSPLLAPVLRLLGARVGRRCHLSSVAGPPSLVEIGDDTSIGYGVRLQPYAVEDGRLLLGPVRLGARCHVGTNSVVLPGARLGDGASLGDQSLLPAGGAVPAGEHWAGSPAARRDAAPPLLRDMAARADDRTWSPAVLAGYVAGVLLFVLAPLAVAGAGFAAVVWAASRHGFGWAALATLATGPLVVLATCLLVLAVKKAVLPSARAGIHRERGAFGLRKWIADGVLTMSLTVTHALYSTLYLVPFLRALGARTGRWSEVATVSFVDPDMLIIGERSFVADIGVVGPAVFHRGRVALAPAEVGRMSFVGNGALVPGSCRMADNSLLGVHSVAPERPVDPETTWLGSPAIFLPRREESRKFPARLTYEPTPGLIAARLAIEYFRVTLPATLGALGVLGAVWAAAQLAAAGPPVALFLLGPALGLGAALAVTLAAVVLKWLVVGRYRPRTEPLWSVWVRRTELITGLYENLVVPAFVNLLTGSPWAAPVLRLFGARIGRRVWLNTTYLTEFDLVDVGDDAAVGEFTSLQTHLFEDRVMKMSRVRVGAGASVGMRSVVLYDARVGAGAGVDALSLVMKGERLPDRTRWRGIPSRPR
ncbi:amino acid adenylation domain-containing protein [Streptomyces sp. AV19]|uniref:Pls/PosA family non-ribosomal peptide synthetase n=1 Tax=Streptomyces sp. AV19 TaxID=2793068 RepID=UPI0018FEBF6A|nr:Pls/PosA family non-ribosomal peptide synthetase [Streptomyces sp. AV19]MBH1937432.1 amino acid adenylation domain-containing protein [Streptomyces sp. AV19]MDG4533795.1 amino acid adenylation domain-containing protein [Streptomyces sp. AV19]